MTAPIAVSMGDPAGIGPELIVAAWTARAALDLPPFYLLADPDLIAARAAKVGVPVELAPCEPEAAAEQFADALPVVPLEARAAPACGTPDPASSAAVVEAIETAVEHLRGGRARGLVTLPITKKTLYDSGFAYPGHTEFLGALARRHWPEAAAEPVMLLAGPQLLSVPITVHIPLARVPHELTFERVVTVARIVAGDLKRRFGLARPRLALAGLNPHAGEGGTLGEEDARVLQPAAAALRAEGLDITDPLPADTMFHARARANYDCALCAYHDQALIPAKTLAFDEAVNVTLGLPFVRTSPDHGTAYDIAGKGIARPDSVIAAIRLAARLAAADQRDGA